MEHCCCGNTLDAGKQTRIKVYPCRCSEPGVKRTTRGTPTPGVPKGQKAEREKLGLPVLTDIERGMDSRWV